MKKIIFVLASLILTASALLVFNTGFNAELQNDIKINSLITKNDTQEILIMLDEKYKSGGLNEILFETNNVINKVLHFTTGNKDFSNDKFIKEEVARVVKS